MFQSKTMRLMAVCMIFAMAQMSVAAAAPAAMLYVNGKVTVNGQAGSRSASLFEGDSIATEAGSAGTISLNGVSVLLDPHTAASFDKANLRLQSGGAIVKTTTGMATTVGDVNINPMMITAKYRVSVFGRLVTITSAEGDVKIGLTERTLALQAGQSVTVVCKTCVTDNQDS